jgi:hypothetical protein
MTPQTNISKNKLKPIAHKTNNLTKQLQSMTPKTLTKKLKSITPKTNILTKQKSMTPNTNILTEKKPKIHDPQHQHFDGKKT